MSHLSSGTCVAAVVTPEYLPGALTMLHSFLKLNAWFDGDILICYDRLDDAGLARIAALHGRVRFEPVSAQLRSAIGDLVARHPDLRRRAARFYKADVLKAAEPQKLIFCDSDLLFRGSIREICSRPALLLACGDGAHYRGEHRLRANYAVSQEASSHALSSTFSSGFMVLDRKLRTEETFQDFIETLGRLESNGFTWSHTDQAVFNIMFEDKHTPLDCAYNYMISHGRSLSEATGIGLEDARIVHFNGWPKPWDPGHIRSTRLRDPEIAGAFDLWRRAYLDYLKDD